MLSECIEIIGGGTPKTSKKEYWGGEIPWLSVVDFNNDNRYVSKTEKTITQEGLDNCSSHLLGESDIILSARGTVGALAQLSKPMAFNQSCYGIRANNLAINDYIYYLLKHSVSVLKKNSYGSVFDTITRETFSRIEVLLPDLKTQKKISAVLGSLDNKIELNEKINQNLEAQAQAIFKSWFVDFDLFGGKKPNDWEETSITNIAEYLNGLPLQRYQTDDKSDSFSVLKIRELRLGRCDDVSDRCTCNIPKEYIIKDGDIIFSWSGTLCLDIWCGGNCALNQHLFKVYSHRYDKWFYYFWTKHYMNRFAQIASNKKTTMGHIKRSDLSDAKVFVPSQDYYTLLNGIITPMVDKIIALRCESRRLSQLRDTLLPKLMSGEIDVSDVAV